MNPHAAARELEWAGSEYMLRWLGGMPDVTITTFGRAWCATSPSLPDLDFVNTVNRLLPDEAARVPEIAAHYAAAGVRPWFELMPAPGFEALADALHAAGARQTGWLAMHERSLPAPAPQRLPPGVELYELGSDIEDFVRVLPEGHGIPADGLPGAIARTRLHAAVEGARLYLATVDGEPAAAAVLLVAGEIGYLANASTLERFRRRGCQGALIRRRLADAAEAGCRRAGVITDWGSQSHANMARAGFTPAYTKAVWRVDAAAGEQD